MKAVIGLSQSRTASTLYAGSCCLRSLYKTIEPGPVPGESDETQHRSARETQMRIHARRIAAQSRLFGYRFSASHSGTRSSDPVICSQSPPSPAKTHEALRSAANLVRASTSMKPARWIRTDNCKCSTMNEKQQFPMLTLVFINPGRAHILTRDGKKLEAE